MPTIQLPSFFDAADSASASGQKAYLWAVRVRLVALVVAAAGGALSVRFNGIDIFAWVALVGFVAAMLVETYVLSASPDRLWYEARAAAESIKTLTWRFSVGGAPFPLSMGDPQTEAALRARLLEVSRDLRHEAMPPTGTEISAIPPDLFALRRGTFEQRRETYRSERINDQRAWYKAKAHANIRRSRQFLLATLILELVGVIAAVLRASNIVEIDLLGIAAAIISGTAAWAQTRQYGSLSSAYSIAARELAVVEQELNSCSEADWPAFVARAEDAISREHTLWRSTHGSVDARIAQ